MADVKISALPVATTPLTGSEVLPIVQSGVTRKVSVDNLTAGKTVAASTVNVDANTASAAVRITQTGAGNALLVEDSANPDATPFVIDQIGRVIVGNTTPFAASTLTPGINFQGPGGTGNANTVGINAFSADANGPVVYFGKSRSATIGSEGLVADGDFLGALFFEGSDGTAQRRGASIVANVDGTPGASDMPGRLVFSTTADGASSPTERMRITNSGLVGIGTATPGRRLTVSGAGVVAGFNSTNNVNVVVISNADVAGGFIGANGTNLTLANNTGVEAMRVTSSGEIYIAGTVDQGAYNLQVNGTGVWGAGAYVNGSDARIKDDIAPLASGLDVVAKLKPVQFRYKESWSKDTALQPGFIAQDLQAAMADQPYLDGVVLQGPEYMSVSYQALIPLLTKAIQEQQAQIEDLKARVTALENK